MQQKRVKLGTAYYPECWPESEWEQDLAYMVEAGIDLVRLAEFAWSRMEPVEGRFDFDWLERFIAQANEVGIQTMLCTPTEAPPPWLSARYPSTLPVDEKGLVKGSGGRRHYCVNSAEYNRCSDAIVKAMGERFGNNPAVTVWQLDNEAGCHQAVKCYCNECEINFRHWLKQKYQNPSTLNQAWFNAFWSHEVSDFDHIVLHKNNMWGMSPQYKLDFQRFGGESWIRFLDRQLDILRPLCPDKKIGHNITWYQEEIDMHKLTKRHDFVGIDIYQREPFKMSFINSWFASIKKDRKHWVMEMPAGIVDGLNRMEAPMPPKKLFMYFMRHYLRGAELCSMWHFRRHPGGAEMFLGACLEHSGKPAWSFDGVVEAGAFIRKHGEKLFSNRPKTDVAILHSYDDLFLGLTFQDRVGSDFMILDKMLPLYETLERRGLGVDFVQTSEELSRYPILFAPQAWWMDAKRAQALSQYVEKGGILVAWNRIGQFDLNGKAHIEELPAYLQDLFGATIGDVYQVDDKHSISGTFCGDWGEDEFQCQRAMALHPTSAETLALFTGHRIPNSAAATRHQVGKGYAYLIGMERLNAETFDDLMERILEERGISFLLPDPKEIECIRGDKLTGYFNLSDGKIHELQFDSEVTDLISEKKSNRFVLEPFGVVVIEKKSE